jgi:hypothetical protein
MDSGKKEGKKKLGIFYEERLPELEPESFHEGFTLRTVLGALFVAIIMMPGAIYLSLMMGQQMGPAAEWTTIILFVEVARRSFTVLRRQEIYLIYYLAGALVVSAGGLMAGAGGPFFWLIWNQYLRRSAAAKNFGIAEAADPRMMIPTWVAPPLDSTAYIQRTFLHHDWVIPILLIVAANVLIRMQWIGLGYVLFRVTSDVERLPFPLAPVAAQGATALAEVSQERETWRWNVFSTGTMVGLLYGFFYVAVPILTGAFQASPQFLIPIPFFDLMQSTEGTFPAGRIGIATDMGLIFFGFVLPFPIVVGGFIGSIFSNFIFAPGLYRLGMARGENLFPTWKGGMNLIQTEISTGFDLWISVGIGVALAIAVIGIGKVLKSALAFHRQRAAQGTGPREGLTAAGLPAGRGDFPIALALGAWAFASLCTVILVRVLVPGFPIWIIAIFAFFWSPLMSYVSARLLGMTGQPISIPYMTEAAFILSKYQGVDIWFAPRSYDYGWAAQRFREIELTGTKFTSVVKAEIFAVLVVLVFSFLYWSFYWKLSDIPAAQYPYAQTFWPLNAFYQCLWATGTLPGGANYLLKAIKPEIIGSALGGAVGVYALMSLLGVHAMWFYGLLAGFPVNVTGYIPMFVGAILGRYYMTRRFGIRRWQLYAPVLAAGYACGVGLTGMFSIAIAIIFKAVRVLPY